MMVASPNHVYEIGDRVANAGKYRLYLCVQDGTERQCLLQIADDNTQNGSLERAAYLLKELKRHADELEAEFALVKTDPKVMLNYDLGFPELVDSFIFHEQGERRVNILAFKSVDDVSKMVPIGNIIQKDQLRIDLRTSAWIMGKALKILAFAHSIGIAVSRIDTANILIEPDQHYVVIFDWSDSRTNTESINRETRKTEISKTALCVIALLGGDYETRSFPDDGGDCRKYSDYLLSLADGDEHDAKKAHTRFYEIIDSLWERAFHPFTSYPLSR